jgi:hypothetical protein
MKLSSANVALSVLAVVLAYCVEQTWAAQCSYMCRDSSRGRFYYCPENYFYSGELGINFSCGKLAWVKCCLIEGNPAQTPSAAPSKMPTKMPTKLPTETDDEWWLTNAPSLRPTVPTARS